MLAEALKIMLCEDRQHDMQKAAAFVKRLATFSLCFGSAESMAGRIFVQVPVSSSNMRYRFLLILRFSFGTFAALVTLKHLLQKNVKCRNLLENDAGGGSVSGSISVSSCHTILHGFNVLLLIYIFA